MNIKALNTFLGAVVIGSAITLTGCGGGSSSSSSSGASVQTYSGTTAAATVDKNNAQSIGTNAGAAVKAAADAQNGSSLPTAVTVNSTSNQSNLEAVSQDLANFFRNQGGLNLPTGFSRTNYGSCGGSVTYSGSNPPASGPYSASGTFSNYCDSYVSTTLAFSGTVAFSTPDWNGGNFTAFTLTFTNLTITDSSLNKTITINSMTISIDTTTNSFSYSADYTGPDGTTVYRTENFNITDNSGSYNGSLTFYDPTYGHVSVNVNSSTPLIFGHCGDYPDSGTVDITGGNGGTASVTYSYSASASPACTYSGSYTTAGGTTGNFNGTTP